MAGQLATGPNGGTPPRRRARLAAWLQKQTLERLQAVATRWTATFVVCGGVVTTIVGIYNSVEQQVVTFLFRDHMLLMGSVIRVIGVDATAILVVGVIVTVSFVVVMKVGIPRLLVNALQGNTSSPAPPSPPALGPNSGPTGGVGTGPSTLPSSPTQAPGTTAPPTP